MSPAKPIAWACIGVLLLAPSAAAREDALAAAKVELSADRTDGSAQHPRKAAQDRLRLGPYGNAYGPPPLEGLRGGPRFESEIDVDARIPRDLNETMAVWWKHFDFETSVYGSGIAIKPPTHPGAFDILPLVDWLVKKARRSRDNP